MKRALRLACLVAALVATLQGAIAAEKFPQGRPMTIVVPFAAGSTSDLFAREVATKLGTRLSVPVIVENRVGGGGSIGTMYVVRAPKDGHTILFHSGGVAIDQSLRKVPLFDAKRSLTPLTFALDGVMGVFVSAALPVNNFPELVAHIKANPGKYNFGSAGTGTSTHLNAELLMAEAGLRMTHIPFGGAAPMQIALMGNTVQVAVVDAFFGKAALDSGKVRLVAVAAKNRSPLLPALPTTAEGGLPNYEASLWYGFFGPPDLPAELTTRLNRELTAILADPAMKASFRMRGLETRGSSPEEFERFVSEEVDKYAKIVRDVKLELQ